MAIKLSGSTIINDSRTLVNYGSVHNVLGNVSGTTTINLQSGNYVSATVVGATTFVFSNPLASPNACGFALRLTNGGSSTVIWPAAVQWPSGTAPTLTAEGIDLLVFITDNGGTLWRGTASMTDVKAA
jgi:hypothetical protein